MLWTIARLIALVGLADATYLTAKHYLGGTVTCHLVTGCDAVLASQYATIGPVPVALLGVGFYGLVLLVLFHPRLPVRGQLLIGLTTLGIFGTLYFLYLQAVALAAFCFYCLVSAATSTTLYALALTGGRTHRRRVVRA